MIGIDEQLEVIARGTVDILVVDELRKKLDAGRPLIIKTGFDPTAPDLHLGHTVLLNKMRQLQDLGHDVVFLIGDFTGKIGDPSGKSETRPALTDEEIAANAATYAEQVYKILDADKTRVEFNSHWFGKMDAADMIRLASQHTVARMLEREDFSKRYGGGQPISIHEFLYPLVQGYDSVALKADMELGGTDQTFNLLVGRHLQELHGQAPQVVLTMPLLEGLDGVKKMSKSLDNYIGIEEPPGEIFGKTMKISDDLMWRYYELISAESVADIERRKQRVNEGENPKHIKEELAVELVTRFHGATAAAAAREDFARRFSQNALPEEIPEVDVGVASEAPLATVLKQAGLTQSSSESHRMVKQGAVKIDGERVADASRSVTVGERFIAQVGKRRIARISVVGAS